MSVDLVLMVLLTQSLVYPKLPGLFHSIVSKLNRAAKLLFPLKEIMKTIISLLIWCQINTEPKLYILMLLLRMMYNLTIHESLPSLVKVLSKVGNNNIFWRKYYPLLPSPLCLCIPSARPRGAAPSPPWRRSGPSSLSHNILM